jgi:hypothetical protein
MAIHHLAIAFFAVLGLDEAGMAEIIKGVEIAPSDQNHGATAAAVAAIGSAERGIAVMKKGDGPIPAFAASNFYNATVS